MPRPARSHAWLSGLALSLAVALFSTGCGGSGGAGGPSVPVVAADAQDGQIALSWSGFSDRGSGIARYVLMSTTARSAPANCTSGTPTYSGTATSFAHTRLTGGTVYRYRLCAVDNAGNFSAGVTGQATAGR